MEAITLNHQQTVDMCFVLLVAGRTELALNKLVQIGKRADELEAELAVERIRSLELVKLNEHQTKRGNMLKELCDEQRGTIEAQKRSIKALEQQVNSLDGQLEEIITGERPQPEKCDGQQERVQGQGSEGQGSR